MQGPDQTEITTEAAEPTEQDIAEASQIAEPSQSSHASAQAVNEKELDWLAIGVMILLEACFAIVTRLNTQPSTSLVPAAILSATGCGLLVTAIRKLRTSQRAGLFEAALAGLLLALFQFVAAITYPNVLHTLSTTSDERLGFLTTWALIAVFSIVFSVIGATLGHLAFAPLRPLPANKQGNASQSAPSSQPFAESSNIQQRPLLSYFITVLLFGLAPTVVGYVFSAAFDYMLSKYQFFFGPYPTLRLLSALLPWQIPIPIDLGANNPNAILLLWRFPVFLGNPGMFDVQALEPYIFNAAALALLLLTMRDHNAGTENLAQKPRWQLYLLLEMILGLLLVFPADLWIVRGLQGLLRNPLIALPMRTLYILDQTTFVLNLFTGPLICLALGIILRLLSNRKKRIPPSAARMQSNSHIGLVTFKQRICRK